MKLLRHFAAFATAMLWSLLVSGPVNGQPYPSKPVHVIVPFTAGSATDILARTFGQKLSELWGQPVIVDNRAGAGGTIGAAVVAKAPADGYTLLVHSAAHAYNPSIYTNLPFDTAKDFIEVVPLAGQPNVLVVAPSAGVKTVAELIALARQKPGQLNFGSAGTGSGTHINAEKFKLAAGMDALHIPYKGTPEALTDTMAGRVTYFFSPISAALPNVREGKLLALGVSTAKRSAALPNVPTIKESGFPDYEMYGWFGILAPTGTPAPIAQKLRDEVAKAVADAGVVKTLGEQGMEPLATQPAEWGKYLASELAVYAKITKDANIKP